jgi:hypothetical protein
LLILEIGALRPRFCRRLFLLFQHRARFAGFHLPRDLQPVVNQDVWP